MIHCSCPGFSRCTQPVIFASSSAFENVFKTLPVLDNLSLGAVREEAERMERKNFKCKLQMRIIGPGELRFKLESVICPRKKSRRRWETRRRR